MRMPHTPIRAAALALPPPRLAGETSFEACLGQRRSTREFRADPLRLDQAGQLLWAAQGITAAGGLRTAPSAGAIYPLRTVLAAGEVQGLDPGLLRYDPDSHSLRRIRDGDPRNPLFLAALGQPCVAACAALIAIAADYRRINREFGDRAVGLATLEAGHAGQNVILQSTALGLGCIGLGRFDPDMVHGAMGLSANEHPLYLIAIGHKLIPG
jgi:SagB-type dehydrogenase family enzyme